MEVESQRTHDFHPNLTAENDLLSIDLDGVTFLEIEWGDFAGPYYMYLRNYAPHRGLSSEMFVASVAHSRAVVALIRHEMHEYELEARRIAQIESEI